MSDADAKLTLHLRGSRRNLFSAKAGAGKTEEAPIRAAVFFLVSQKGLMI